MNKIVPDLCLHYFLGGRNRQLKKDGRYYAVQKKKKKQKNIANVQQAMVLAVLLPVS